MRNLTTIISRYVRIGINAALGLGIAFCPPTTPRAQRVTESPVKIIGVSSRAAGGDAVISISADAPLTRAQTWQDTEGFHIVVYKGESALRSGLARGVKMRRVGDSLEIVVDAKPGANVMVQPHFSRLDLTVNGGLRGTEGMLANDTLKNEARPVSEHDEQQAVVDRRGLSHSKRSIAASNTANEVVSATKSRNQSVHISPSGVALQSTLQVRPQTNAPQLNDVSAPSPQMQANSVMPASSDVVAQTSAPTMPIKPTAVEPRASQPQTVEVIQLGSVFSSSVILLFFVCILLVLLFIKYRQQTGKDAVEEYATVLNTEAEAADPTILTDTNEQRQGERRQGERRKQGNRWIFNRQANDQPMSLSRSNVALAQSAERHEHKSDARSHATAAPTVLFGAYQIDLEVEKLVLGQPHRVDVLASRASEDRRAIETSVMKVLYAPESSEDERRRARAALEDYGFVARHSAALLLAPDTYERTSAARVLGEIQSPSSLPFLLEALYDAEIVVRTEAVTSLGALRLPSAIGALLDIARRHPEIPASVIGSALNACSVEPLMLSLGTAIESSPFALSVSDEFFTGEITCLEPTEAVEQLPEWLEDESLADALERLESVDVEARMAAAQSLARFQVQRSVDALAAMAMRDAESSVRATAVTCLSTIGHESVFAPVLIALSDESREVRAAAARALSRLSFNRADAYVRVIETSDDLTLKCVAQACIKSGMVAQAIDRLTSEDRRQAYEAFSLLSLVVKAGEMTPLLNAIENHHNNNIRLAAVRLLGMAGRPELIPQLRDFAVRGEVPEKVRAAILDILYRAEHVHVATV